MLPVKQILFRTLIIELMLDQAHRRATDIKEIHIIFVEAVEEGTEFKCLEQLRINSTATFTTV